MAEDPRLAAVVDQQRREETDERRLPRAVLAEDGDALAAGDRERDVGERRPRTLSREAARLFVLAVERLPQVAHLDGGRLAVRRREVKSDVGSARVMLLLQKVEVMEPRRGKPPERRPADLAAQCTTAPERRISRWEHEAVLETVQARLDHHPEKMTMRRQTAEHPFGTIKCWMGATHFLTKRLPKVATEMALNVLAYNMKRVMAIIGVVGLLEAMQA